MKGLIKSKKKITILHSHIKDNMYHFAHFLPQTKHSKLEAGILNTEQSHTWQGDRGESKKEKSKHGRI